MAAVVTEELYNNGIMHGNSTVTTALHPKFYPAYGMTYLRVSLLLLQVDVHAMVLSLHKCLLDYSVSPPPKCDSMIAADR